MISLTLIDLCLILKVFVEQSPMTLRSRIRKSTNFCRHTIITGDRCCAQIPREVLFCPWTQTFIQEFIQQPAGYFPFSSRAPSRCVTQKASTTSTAATWTRISGLATPQTSSTAVMPPRNQSCTATIGCVRGASRMDTDLIPQELKGQTTTSGQIRMPKQRKRHVTRID